MSSILRAALQVWSSGKKRNDDDDASSEEEEDNDVEPMTQQQYTNDAVVDSPQMVGKSGQPMVRHEEEEEESADWSQLETQRESDLILKLSGTKGTATAEAAAEPPHSPRTTTQAERSEQSPPLSPNIITTPQIHNHDRIVAVDEPCLAAALAVPPPPPLEEMNLHRLRSMSRVFTALPPTLPSYRHMVLDQLEFLTHLLLLEPSPTRLRQIQNDHAAAVTHFCSLPQGLELWNAPGRLRSRSMLAAFALDLALLVRETNNNNNNNTTTEDSSGVEAETMTVSPSTLTAADWDSLKEKLLQLRTILLQGNANRAPEASTTTAAVDPDPQESLAQHAMMTVDFDHVVHLLEVQRALACFRSNLDRIAQHGQRFRKNNQAVQRTVQEYVETLKRLFPTTTNNGDGKKNDKDNDDDDDSDMFANDEEAEDATSTIDDMANVPKELQSFVLTDLYLPKQPMEPQEGLVERLLEHVQSLIDDTATPTGTTPGRYSYAHLLATARSLWIKWSESILDIPALVQLGYAGVISPIVNLRGGDHEDDVSSWGGDGVVGEDLVEPATHHHQHHPSRQRSRSSSSKQYPPPSHSTSLPRNQSVTADKETVEARKKPAFNVVPPATSDQTVELNATRASNVVHEAAPTVAEQRPPPQSQVAPGNIMGAKEMATALAEDLITTKAPPMPKEPPASTKQQQQKAVADPRPRVSSQQPDAAPPAVEIVTQGATQQPQLASSTLSTKVPVQAATDEHLYSSSDDEDRPLLRSQRDLLTVLPPLSMKRKRDAEPDLTDSDSVENVALPRRRKTSSSTTPKRTHRRSSENSINQDSGARKTTTLSNASDTSKKKKKLKHPRAVLWSSDSDDGSDNVPIRVKVARTKPLQKRRAFTDEETAAILKGVRVFGTGRWVEIQLSDPCLQHRTNGQIKDKYRTMTNSK